MRSGQHIGLGNQLLQHFLFFLCKLSWGAHFQHIVSLGKVWKSYIIRQLEISLLVEVFFELEYKNK